MGAGQCLLCGTGNFGSDACLPDMAHGNTAYSEITLTTCSHSNTNQIHNLATKFGTQNLDLENFRVLSYFNMVYR